MLISPCGIICDECPFYNHACSGCKNLEGKVFWSADITENGSCPMYDCAVDVKQLGNCGTCNELPCELFYATKDPDISDDQHQESIVKRVNVLKQQH
jgi:hypothetical protein